MEHRELHSIDCFGVIVPFNGSHQMKNRAKVGENVYKIAAAIVLIDTHNILDI